MINILLYRWSAEHCMCIIMLKPPRNFKHFKHLRFMCVYITRYVLLMLCITIRKIFKSILLHFVCVFCFILYFFCFVFRVTIWAKCYTRTKRGLHTISFSIVSRCGFEAHSDIIICHQQSDLLKSWVFKRKWLLTLFLLLLLLSTCSNTQP